MPDRAVTDASDFVDRLLEIDPDLRAARTVTLRKRDTLEVMLRPGTSSDVKDRLDEALTQAGSYDTVAIGQSNGRIYDQAQTPRDD